MIVEPAPRGAARRPLVLCVLLAIVLLGAGLRLKQVTRTDGVTFDSTRYVPTAYNLSHGRWAVRESALGHGLEVDRLYAPFYPATMALAGAATGDLVVAGQLVSMISGIAAIVATFALGVRAHGPLVGLLAALLTATSLQLISYSAQVMTESIFSLLLIAALVAFPRPNEGSGRAVIAGVALALGFITKPAAVTFAVVLGTALAVRWLRAPGRRPFGQLVAFCLPVAVMVVAATLIERRVLLECAIDRNSALPFLHTLDLYDDPAFPGWADPNGFSMTGWALDHPTRYVWYFGDAYRAGIGALAHHPPAVLVALAAFGLMARRFGPRRAHPRSPLWPLLWPLLASFPLVSSLVIVHEQFMERMVLPVGPLLFVLVGGGLVDLAWSLRERLPARRDQPAPRLAMVVAVVVGLVCLAVVTGLRTVKRHIPGDDNHKKPAWRAAGRWINVTVPSVEIIDDGDYFISGYVLRHRLTLSWDAIVERIVEHRPGDAPRFVLLTIPEHLERLERLRGTPEGRHVTPLRVFGDDSYTCLVARVGE